LNKFSSKLEHQTKPISHFLRVCLLLGVSLEPDDGVLTLMVMADVGVLTMRGLLPWLPTPGVPGVAFPRADVGVPLPASRAAFLWGVR